MGQPSESQWHFRNRALLTLFVAIALIGALASLWAPSLFGKQFGNRSDPVSEEQVYLPASRDDQISIATNIWRLNHIISILPYNTDTNSFTVRVDALATFGADWQALRPDLAAKPEQVALNDFRIAVWPSDDVSQQELQWLMQANYRDERYLYFIVPVDDRDIIPCSYIAHLFHNNLDGPAIAFADSSIYSPDCFAGAPDSGPIGANDGYFIAATFGIIAIPVAATAITILRRRNWAIPN